ncbi:HlyD family type I secretion periplasmic adaptor subunit [Kaistia sp. 32K]|uniref:HlyD family type I secretion periplasmic adaptor subunit n=1 Tax=Kaistia sp. 32K TaxID=2795690 RepID=UPI0019156122|nr:HlyD family type I secretion periplasmic adaptor subunit [Kaistia sp. 32K]BCP53274.1 HlyD family type I secretion periplasmic adaptor subunit [Kaistia sp. 32K]
MKNLTRQTPAEIERARRDAVPAIVYATALRGSRNEILDREPSLRTPIIAGFLAVTIGFGGFIGWAYSANLDSAAVASGSVVVDSKRKTVSHFEGGILKRLLVKEGDSVKAGQPLILLDDTRARSELQQLTGRRFALTAKLARLRSEQAEANSVEFPSELLASTEQAARDAVAAEQKFFESRTVAKSGRLDVQRKSVEQHDAEAAALAAQSESNRRQQEILEEQRSAIDGLVKKGFARRSQLLEIDSRLSELIGNAGEQAANKAKAEQAKAGANLELLALTQDWMQQVSGDIATAQGELAEVDERIVAARDVLQRLEVRSPQAGVIVNIQVRTVGGAISAGAPLMDIVPEDEPMVIEAHVSPTDIDSVRVGSPVRVRLTAYNQRSHAPLEGRLTYVAADHVIDERTNVAYFVTRAEVLPEALAAARDVKLYPGMPADVLIINKPRLAIDYLLSPITDSFNAAFHEE